MLVSEEHFKNQNEQYLTVKFGRAIC